MYEVVLDANLAAIEKVRPGNDWNEPHEAAVRIVTHGLVKLGLLKGRVPALIRAEAYKRFFMHRTGHWLGMDVHDVGDYKVGDEWRVLEPGMVMTIEPGIYIAPGARDVPKAFRGIGIRIEDDVAVTSNGADVLTKRAPKDPDEIESADGGVMSERRCRDRRRRHGRREPRAGAVRHGRVDHAHRNRRARRGRPTELR